MRYLFRGMCNRTVRNHHCGLGCESQECWTVGITYTIGCQKSWDMEIKVKIQESKPLGNSTKWHDEGIKDFNIYELRCGDKDVWVLDEL